MRNVTISGPLRYCHNRFMFPIILSVIMGRVAEYCQIFGMRNEQFRYISY